MMSAGRWTQFDEDAYRLPEGFKRVAYDADTQRYTFQDREGTLYLGKPREVYGVMLPVKPAHAAVEAARPMAFGDDVEEGDPSSESELDDDATLAEERPSTLTTFDQFLPSTAFAPADSPTRGHERSNSSPLEKSAPAITELKRSLSSARQMTPGRRWGKAARLARSFTLPSKRSQDTDHKEPLYEEKKSIPEDKEEGQSPTKSLEEKLAGIPELPSAQPPQETSSKMKDKKGSKSRTRMAA